MRPDREKEITAERENTALDRVRSVAVRLEGGLGDHILGMRLLPFIRQRCPEAAIVAYSDCGGHTAPMEAAAMSPLVTRVVPLRHRAIRITNDDMGHLDNVDESDLALMRSADLFLDAYGGGMFATAAVALQTPLFEILSHRPELRVPPASLDEAARMLLPYGNALFVGLNLSKYDPSVWRTHGEKVKELLLRILDTPNTIVLALFTSQYDHQHWGEPARTLRNNGAIGEAKRHQDLAAMSPRIVPCMDLPIATVAGLLLHCRYFLGVDNGLKHLAWALGVPYNYLHPDKPPLNYVLRWMPDLHRMVILDVPGALDSCASTALAALAT